LSEAAIARRSVGARPPFLSLRALAVLCAGVLTTGAASLIVKALLIDHEAWSAASAGGLLIFIGAMILTASGFAAGWLARKLCALEVVCATLVAAALAHIPVALTWFAHQPWPLAIDPQTYETYAITGALGAGLIAFLGSSFGFMLGGGGRLDLGLRYELFVALTFLKLRGQRQHAGRFSPSAVVTLIAILAVVIGVMALTIVLSVMSGFELDLKHKILGTNAHAIVLKYGSDFREYPEVRQKVLGTPGVLGATPFTLNEVMVSSDSNLSGVVMKGIDPKTIGTVTELSRNVREGSLEWLDTPSLIPPPSDADPGVGTLTDRLNKLLEEENTRNGSHHAPVPAPPPEPPPKPKKLVGPEEPALPGIVIGRELAKSLRVWVGDTVHVVSPLSNELGPSGPIPKSRRFRVAAIFFSGMYEYDSKFAYIGLTEAQKFFALDGAVTGLEIKVADLDATKRVTRDLLVALDGYPYHTKDWGEMNRNLFAALAMEKLVMAVILGFASLPVGFLILAILMFLAFEKSKEIAVLKSMGARDQSIMKVFVLEGLVIGGVGTLVGLAIGGLICVIIAHGAIKLDPSVYYIDSLPVRIEIWQFGLVALSALVLSYLATIFPAVAASRLAPVEGLRND
jgi:lipoprotein-releasing system permease protein